jgi:hypothetical protein
MRLKFGDCVLDLRARQLERRQKVVPLEPMAPGRQEFFERLSIVAISGLQKK